jgi:hypothetical protein
MKVIETRQTLKFRLFKRINFMKIGVGIIISPLIATVVFLMMFYARVALIVLYSLSSALLVILLSTMFYIKNQQRKKEAISGIETQLRDTDPELSYFIVKSFTQSKHFNETIISMLINEHGSRNPTESIFNELVRDYQIHKRCVIDTQDPTRDDASSLLRTFYRTERILIFYALLKANDESAAIGIKAIRDFFEKEKQVNLKPSVLT